MIIQSQEHGTDFLMDIDTPADCIHVNKWLIQQIRNAIIYATYEFFDKNGFIKFDSPFCQEMQLKIQQNCLKRDYFGTPLPKSIWSALP